MIVVESVMQGELSQCELWGHEGQPQLQRLLVGKIYLHISIEDFKCLKYFKRVIF